MNQDYYDYIRKTHDSQFRFALEQRKLARSAPENQNFRSRSLLYLSDLLLNMGQRVRPVEFQVDVKSMQTHDGTLEIKAKGC